MDVVGSENAISKKIGICMPIGLYRVAGFYALVMAAICAAAYVFIWGLAMSFGMSFDSASEFYIALYPMLLLPIVVLSFFSRIAGFAAMMCHVVISWIVAAFSVIPSLYRNPLDSKISFIPFVILVCVVFAFICSKQKPAMVDAHDPSL
jgi:hypothetical protein